MDDLEERINDFTSEWFRMTFRIDQRVPFDTYGTTASMFFPAFEKAFSVDLSRLKDYWEYHFPLTRGFSLNRTVAILAAWIGAAVLHIYAGWPIWVGVIVLMILGFINWRAFRRTRVPITVQDLVDAARAGKWVMEYDFSPIGNLPGVGSKMER